MELDAYTVAAELADHVEARLLGMRLHRVGYVAQMAHGLIAARPASTHSRVTSTKR